MRRLILLPLMLAMAGNAAAQTRQATARPCITAAEVEGLTLFLMPELIRTTAETCRPHLPAGAALLRPDALIAKYRAESAGAWPVAQAALAKVVDPQARQLLGTETGRAMLPALAAPMIAREIKPADCPVIDRAVRLLEPLPPRNTAGIVAMLAQLGGNGRNRPFEVCPLVRGAR